MPGGRQIPSDVIDIREYKKNNQVRDFKNIVIAPFAAEANKTYLLCSLPKGAVCTNFYIHTPTDNKLTSKLNDHGIKISKDISKDKVGVNITHSEVYPDGGDLFITPGAAQTNGYVIAYMNTGITDGAYAG